MFQAMPTLFVNTFEALQRVRVFRVHKVLGVAYPLDDGHPVPAEVFSQPSHSECVHEGHPKHLPGHACALVLSPPEKVVLGYAHFLAV